MPSPPSASPSPPAIRAAPRWWSRLQPAIRERRAEACSSRSLDFEDRLDFDGDAVRERPHANGGARVPPRIAEERHEEIGAAINDLGLLAEARRAVHHPQQLDDAANAIERPERGL